MGHPVLRHRAATVEDPTDPQISALAADMLATMGHAFGVGLAAPQVGIAQRLFVYHIPAVRLGPDETAPAEPRVLINPEITPLSPELEADLEGCLSIPDIKGIVNRYRRVYYRAYDPAGQLIEGEATGFHARVLQHENDHLNGILYLDRMDDLTTLAYLDWEDEDIGSDLERTQEA